MFSKAKDTPEQPAAAAPAAPTRRSGGRTAAPSIISGDMSLVGKIDATGDIQIDGKVKGDVTSGSLTIGEKAYVEGEIIADEVTVRGHVSGSIRGRKVQLASTCRVEGDILHSALAVETGAFFEGNCRHSDDPMSEKMDSPRAATSGRGMASEDRSGGGGSSSSGSGAGTGSGSGGSRPGTVSGTSGRPGDGSKTPSSGAGTVIKPPLGATGTGGKG